MFVSLFVCVFILILNLFNIMRDAPCEKWVWPIKRTLFEITATVWLLCCQRTMESTFQPFIFHIGSWCTDHLICFEQMHVGRPILQRAWLHWVLITVGWSNLPGGSYTSWFTACLPSLCPLVYSPSPIWCI